MNSAPLPEFQLKKCLSYLTASAAHSGHTSYFLPLYRYSIRHLQSWRCSVEQQNFPSCNIHTTYLSHQFENLSLFGPFNVFSLELELMLFSSWAGVPIGPRRDWQRAELSTGFTQYVNPCSQQLVSQINRTKRRRKEERWSDRSRSCSGSLREQWDQNRSYLSPRIAPVAPSGGYFMKSIHRLWGFNYFFAAFPLLPLHVTSSSCGAGYCQSSK